jgi:c-di-GMP-binding flagellar brake protein YcgR
MPFEEFRMLDKIRQALYGRRHHRVLTDPDFPVELHINALGKRYDIGAYDISEGGLGFELPANISARVINTPLSLTVSLPGENVDEFIVVAEIRHVTREVYGIEFCDLERTHRRKIAAYVKDVAKRKPKLLMKGVKESSTQGLKQVS